MAKNPMQRQARNSFLIGIIIGLILTAAVGAILFMQMKKLNQQIQAYESALVNVYVLNQDVKSGQELTASMFEQKKVTRDSTPANASDIITSINTSQKKFIAKVDLSTNTVITNSMVDTIDDVTTNDKRQQEYNVVILPTDLMTGDYVDIRLMLPNGEDFVVVSKKTVTIPMSNGEYLADTIWMDLGEDEILSMSSAIVEAYKIEGSKLYATKYTDPGIQEAATPTYVASREVTTLMDSDPNITEEARAGLQARYTDNLKNLREQYIQNAISTYGSDDNVPSGMEESITSTQESRQEYLQGLAGGAATTSGTTGTTTTTNTTTAQ